jgi:hypothetical protein
MTVPMVVKHQETKNGDDDNEAAQDDGKQRICPPRAVGAVMHIVLQIETSFENGLRAA